MHVLEEDSGVSSGSSSDAPRLDTLHGEYQNATNYPAACLGVEEDFSGKLPASLWSDDIEISSLGEQKQTETGLDHENFISNFNETMNQDEKKQAALKTIADLQHWATMKNGGRTTPTAPENGDMAADPRRAAAWQAMLQQQTLLQQQQQRIQQAAALQRIIQDYLSGKQLTLIEQQILQQYIRQQQEQHFQPSYASNELHRTASYQNSQNMNHMRPQALEQEHLAHAYQDRLSMAAAAAAATAATNGSMQARMNQAHMEALLAVQRQQQNIARQNYYTPTADPRYVQSHQHAEVPTPWARQGMQNQSMNGYHGNGYNGGISSNGHQYHVPTRMPASEPSAFQMSNVAPPPSVATRPAAAGAARGREGITNPVQTLRDIGKTLFHLGITVEGAVNAGLLGGLSASDVRIVLESYRIETELNSPVSNAATQNVSIPFGPRTSHVSVPPNTRLERAKSGSFSNLSAPNPSSPAWSASAASTGSLPLHMGSNMQKSPRSKGASIADDDSSDGLLDQIIESSTDVAKMSKKETTTQLPEKDSLFDATQYGFFESVSKSGEDSGELDDSLEGGRDNGDSSRDIEESGLLNYLNGLKLGTDFS